MDLVNTLLNLLLPALSVIIVIIMFPFYLIFKLFVYIKNSIQSEDVSGKVVLITGASSGIGEETTYEYARRGARLVIVARREERLRAVANKALKLGSPEVIHVCADVSKSEDSKRFIEEAINHFGKLDHLVNNAGVSLSLYFDTYSVSDMTHIMDINFWGSVYSTHYALPYLRKSKGKIVMVSSVLGRFPKPRSSIYSASKGALIRMYETLRVEVGSEIGITIVIPGLVSSEMTTRKHQSNEKIPMESASDFAKVMVESVCRGDRCVTEPSWWEVIFMLKAIYPELLDLVLRSVYMTNKTTKLT